MLGWRSKFRAKGTRRHGRRGRNLLKELGLGEDNSLEYRGGGERQDVYLSLSSRPHTKDSWEEARWE